MKGLSTYFCQPLRRICLSISMTTLKLAKITQRVRNQSFMNGHVEAQFFYDRLTRRLLDFEARVHFTPHRLFDLLQMIKGKLHPEQKKHKIKCV